MFQIKEIKSLNHTIRRIRKLVEDLRLLARLDRAPNRFQMAEGRLDFLVRGMEAQLRLLAEARQLEFPDPLDVKVVFDYSYMKQVVLNLFQNAVLHTDPKQGAISITLKRAGNRIVMAVRDNGPCIPERHLPHLFERFYRINTAPARKSGGSGSGLGLAITKSIVEIHGGTIQCQSKPGEGAIFLVQLPINESD
ncbi:MAG: HAMP domain-containing sensor histidine kinase [Tumebacillaceae bacterium]